MKVAKSVLINFVVSLLFQVFASASKFVGEVVPRKGYITLKSERVPDLNSEAMKELTTYDEFHPLLFNQHASNPSKEFDTFDQVTPLNLSKLDAKCNFC